MSIFETLGFYFTMPYVWYAIIAGVLISLCASLLGVTLVMKRLSFIGDGLSHVAFGAVALSSSVKFLLTRLEASFAAELPDTLIVLPVTLIASLLLLRLSQNAKIKGDAVIAMISVGSLAFGYMLMSAFPMSSNVSGDVCATLFGSTSIITLKLSDALFCLALAILLVGAFVLCYNRIFALTYDENFAKATGANVGAYNLIIALMIGVIIVIGMELIGSLLISALVVFPALSAMRVFKSFKSVIVCSAGLSAFCSLIGILLSMLINTPVGASIVAVNIVAFGVFTLVGKLRS